jgi:hypothetical protein
MFVPTIPMVSKPFDINLEENVHGVFAVQVSDASAPNEVSRRSLTILSRKVTQEGKVQKCKSNKHSTHQHDRIQSISATQLKLNQHVEVHTNLLHHNMGHRSVQYDTETYCFEEVRQGFRCSFAFTDVEGIQYRGHVCLVSNTRRKIFIRFTSN